MTSVELFDVIHECCLDCQDCDARIIDVASYVEGKAYGDGPIRHASPLSAAAFVLAIILASCGWPT